MFYILAMENVPFANNWESIFGQISDFFGPLPGSFQECLGTIGERPRTIFGLFRDTCWDVFRTCLGSVPGLFLSIFRLFPGILEDLPGGEGDTGSEVQFESADPAVRYGSASSNNTWN